MEAQGWEGLSAPCLLRPFRGEFASSLANWPTDQPINSTHPAS